MYSKCGHVQDARSVFDNMTHYSVVSWTAMIAGYAHHQDCSNEGLVLFQEMIFNGHIPPNSFTFLSAINACANLADLQSGRLVHVSAIINGFEGSVFVVNSLINMYMKSDSIEDAFQVFGSIYARDLVTWTILITEYTKQGCFDKAFQMFHQMECEGFPPDQKSLSSVLHACALSGYGQNEDLEKANEMLLEMEQYGLQANTVTFVSTIAACAMVGSLKLSMKVHTKIVKCGKEMETVIANALVDTYFKCGDVQCASLVFNKMIFKDIISWNSMISGYGLHGYVRESLLHAKDMQDANIEHNDITYLGLLSACSRVGLLYEGVHLFMTIIRGGCFLLKNDHFVCIVDMLARIGNISDAVEVVKIVPHDTCAVISRSLLNGCKLHGDIELAISVIKNMINCEEDDASAFALLINTFAAEEYLDRQCVSSFQ